MNLNIGIITLFPEAFSCLEHGVIGRAILQGKIKFKFLQS